MTAILLNFTAIAESRENDGHLALKRPPLANQIGFSKLHRRLYKLAEHRRRGNQHIDC